MTHTYFVLSAYKAGFSGHLATHLHVELSAYEPAGHSFTHLIVLLSAKESAGHSLTQKVVRSSANVLQKAQFATHRRVLFYPYSFGGHLNTHFLVEF